MPWNSLSHASGRRAMRESAVGQDSDTVAAVFALDRSQQPFGDSYAWYLTPDTLHDNENSHGRDVK
jgi:hypothetical protein